MDKNKVLLDTTITSIDLKNKIVTTNAGDKYKFEYLINTAPLNHFLELFGDEEFERLKDELSYNKVLVFNLYVY